MTTTMLKSPDGVAVVMVGILMFGATTEQHNRRLASAEDLKGHGLKLDKAKCHFGKTENR